MNKTLKAKRAELEGAPIYYVCPNCSQWLATEDEQGATVLHPQIVPSGDSFVFPAVAQGYLKTVEGQAKLAELELKMNQASEAGEWVVAKNIKQTIKIFSDPAFPRPDWRPISIAQAVKVVCQCGALDLVTPKMGGAAYILPKSRRKLPLSLAHPTFPEAKAGALAISDGRDWRDWHTVEGALALVHAPKSAAHQVRFEPNNILVSWWGKPPADAESLWEELKKMDMDSVMLYHVALANILFDPKARFTASLDEMIKAIGREGEAKRNIANRAEWRHKVWRTLLLFDSLAIIGARSGTWREPGSAGEKRDKMAAEKLISRDALFRIIGTQETQGSFDKSEPPKEVSLVPGEWLMQFHGNREILSEFGDVLKIAAIPRGQAAGNWAACVGLMLNQIWRERAARATRKRAGQGETLDFGTFTRRQLLEKTLRSDHDVSELLEDPKGRGDRVREYWKAAIRKLKKVGIIGHYSEGDEPAHEDWRERWLDQPLDIRPKSAMPQALEINASATKARRRTPPKKAPELEAPGCAESTE
jgi:hypothetical protein